MHKRESKNTIQNNVKDLDIKEITGRLYIAIIKILRPVILMRLQIF